MVSRPANVEVLESHNGADTMPAKSQSGIIERKVEVHHDHSESGS